MGARKAATRESCSSSKKVSTELGMFGSGVLSEDFDRRLTSPQWKIFQDKRLTKISVVETEA